VVPVVAVAIIVFALLFLWRRRKQKKNAEDLRRKEVEEYGFNPNNDPTLPAVAAVATGGGAQMAEDGNGGYRGWGATPMVRKPSTNLSSGNGPIGMAFSDNGTAGPNNSPPNGPSSETRSHDPLVAGHRPLSAESEGVSALGVAPATASNPSNIHRGPSNASSSYSVGNHSENSGDVPLPGAPHPANYYSTDAAYNFDDPYMPEMAGQPVIRDVQARRNTRIENPTILPQQGNSGIAQNF
jgi:hypothetical protein